MAQAAPLAVYRASQVASRSARAFCARLVPMADTSPNPSPPIIVHRAGSLSSIPRPRTDIIDQFLAVHLCLLSSGRERLSDVFPFVPI